MTRYFIVAVLLVVAICYAHVEIPRFTKGARKRVVAHAVLILAGCACGAVSLWTPGLSAPRSLAFVIGFGVVHLPAAAIVFLKHLRGSERS
jgi:hypothetical protein